MCENYIEKILEINSKKKMYAQINTFGCQMNAHDSEYLSSMISSMGYEIIKNKSLNFDDNKQEPDLVLFNTCCIRENPETKLFGNLGFLKNKKKLNKNLKIILCGCMMQEQHVIEKIKSNYDFVDVVIGTFNIDKLPELLFLNLKTNKQVMEIIDSNNKKSLQNDFDLGFEKTNRKYIFKASVNIIYGCNNFCSYCIVPFVRGREVSRDPKSIINEIKFLVDDGVKEIMLLGQNVNSYGLDFKDSKINFAELLYKINDINGLERIRFMSSHPKDLSDELIFAMRDLQKVCKHIHLPVQSGSNEILKKMNRKYTREKYFELANKLKNINVEISTDIIVGFPGETDSDFNDTLDLIKKVKFSNAFSFIFSPRENTRAYDMPNKISKSVIDLRFKELLFLLKEVCSENSKKFLGTTQKVLVEDFNYKKNNLSGRDEFNNLVHVDINNSIDQKKLIGSFVDVKINRCTPFYLEGVITRK